MHVVTHEPEPVALPTGYRAVSIEPMTFSSALRIALIVKESPDPVGGPFISVGHTADAAVYLGAVVDAAGGLREWLEIWIQNVDHLAGRYHGHETLLTNDLLDQRWMRQVEYWRTSEPDAFLTTGWETQHPLPVFLDLRLENAQHPRDLNTGEYWQLCTNDDLLRRADLPPYSSSRDRYLTLGGEAPEPRYFVPITEGAPENSATIPLAEAVGSLVPFNPAGGLMMIRRFAPLKLEEWSDLLAGIPWKGLDHGKKQFRFTGAYSSLRDAATVQHGAGHLLLAAQGRAGRLLEAYHLKLQTLLEAVRRVRAWVEHEQLPFLNLTSESFRVELTSVDNGLPFLWTGRTQLAHPGEALALPVQSGGSRYFASADSGTASIFRPSALSTPVRGSAAMRVRKIQGEENEIIVEGTLTTSERVTITPNDLLCLQFSLPAGRLELFGRWEDASESLSSRELRFRTLPQAFSLATVTALRDAEGIALPHVLFETLPVISTPCDLYALAVVATRMLLVNPETTLPVALDELLSFAKLLGESHDPNTPASSRAAALAERDPRWQMSLGPHRLLAEAILPVEASTLFPLDLWWETIALLARMFPAIGPDSFCHDFGDAPSLALHRVFDEPLAQLESLLIRSRSLIVIDWNQNREIRSIIDQMLSRNS